VGKIDGFFFRVLDDNIKACDLAEYTNKAKLFRFIYEICENVGQLLLLLLLLLFI